MYRFLLDTDHLSLLLGGDEQIYAQVEQHTGDVGVTIITNQRDFSLVPNLAVEDWTKPETL